MHEPDIRSLGALVLVGGGLAALSYALFQILVGQLRGCDLVHANVVDGRIRVCRQPTIATRSRR